MKSHNTSTQSKNRYALFLLVAVIVLFVGQRGGLILYGYTHIAHPSYDEPTSGTLSHDFSTTKLRTSVIGYQYVARSGDVLLEGLLLTPFYRFFGSSIASMKLFALLTSTITLAIWIYFILRYQGIWPAIFFTVLFAFPPPTFARLNLVGTVTSHHILTPIVAAQLIPLFRIMESRKAPMSNWLWWLFGFFAGLGTYAFYTYILFNVFCVMFLVICAFSSFTRRRIFFFFGGCLVGFSPWIFRSLLSPEGGFYLKSLLKSSGINLWQIAQTFCYNLPQSLGYGYPLREISPLSIVFVITLGIITFFIIKAALVRCRAMAASPAHEKVQNLPDYSLQQLFVCLFPIFFLLCLSLSSKQIVPFEYVPNYGLFAAFPPGDFLRYRWLHILYPFYLATLAIGIVHMYQTRTLTTWFRYGLCVIFAIILIVGIRKTTQLYSIADYGKTFFYKGYDYDYMAAAFILGDLSKHDMKIAEKITTGYPDENKPSAYRCLGSRFAISMLDRLDRDAQICNYFENTVPPEYREDFMYGLVRTIQMVPEKSFLPIKALLADKYPKRFYTAWGFRHLGYKYFGNLVNHTALFNRIPSGEQWFYKDFLENFSSAYSDPERKADTTQLLQEINSLAIDNRPYLLRGLGKLIGSEMLFDPLCTPDYPLSSEVARQFPSDLQKAFYEGIGSGFAETLCRFWRRLMPPETMNPDTYHDMLELEWQRCISLLKRMPPAFIEDIKKGFYGELKKRKLNADIENFISKIKR